MPRTIIDRPFPWHWIGWGTIVFALAILGSYATTQRISRPLRQVINGAEQIRNGRTIKPLPLDSVSEFREVSQAFNEMSANLSKTVSYTHLTLPTILRV